MVYLQRAEQEINYKKRYRRQQRGHDQHAGFAFKVKTLVFIE